MVVQVILSTLRLNSWLICHKNLEVSGYLGRVLVKEMICCLTSLCGTGPSF